MIGQILLNFLKPKERLKYLEEQNNRRNTALDLAAGQGSGICVDFLLKAQSEAFVLSKWRMFYIACKDGHLSVVSALLAVLLSEDAKLAFIQLHNSSKCTALMGACASGNYELVKLLLDSLPDHAIPAYILKMNESYATALHYACGGGKIMSFSWELEDSKFDSWNHDTSYTPPPGSRLAIVTLLLNHLPTKDRLELILNQKYGDTPLFRACALCEHDVVSLLIESLPQDSRVPYILRLNYSKRTAIFYACENGSIVTVHMLLQVLPEATRYKYLLSLTGGYDILKHISMKGKSEMVSFLIHTLPVEHRNHFIFHPELTESLLPSGQRYSSRSSPLNRDHLLTPLMLACKYRHVDIVAALLEGLPSPEARCAYILYQNEDQTTALICTSFDRTDLALPSMLISNLSRETIPTAILARDKNGYSAFRHAKNPERREYFIQQLVAQSDYFPLDDPVILKELYSGFNFIISPDHIQGSARLSLLYPLVWPHCSNNLGLNDSTLNELEDYLPSITLSDLHPLITILNNTRAPHPHFLSKAFIHRIMSPIQTLPLITLLQTWCRVLHALDALEDRDMKLENQRVAGMGTDPRTTGRIDQNGTLAKVTSYRHGHADDTGDVLSPLISALSAFLTHLQEGRCNTEISYIHVIRMFWGDDLPSIMNALPLGVLKALSQYITYAENNLALGA